MNSHSSFERNLHLETPSEIIQPWSNTKPMIIENGNLMINNICDCNTPIIAFHLK